MREGWAASAHRDHGALLWQSGELPPSDLDFVGLEAQFPPVWSYHLCMPSIVLSAWDISKEKKNFLLVELTFRWIDKTINKVISAKEKEQHRDLGGRVQGVAV